MVRAEIITIGDEILYGQILDTNTQWISLELDKIGIKTIRKSSVGDQESEILSILEEAQHRADIVFITGGLGPTKDDLTKKVLAKFFGCDMAYHPQALEDVRVFFEKRGRELSDLNRDQALLPTKAQYVQNKQGTAPGMWFEEKGTVWVSMAGVPFEMKAIMEELVLPRVAQHFQTPTIVHKIVKVVGIGESYLSDMIQDWELSLPSHIKLAYLPSLGIVKLRLTGFGDSVAQLNHEIQQEIDRVMPIIKPFVFGYEKDELSQVIGQLLVKNSATISLAESCTGGYLSHLFTEIPGSSAYFKGAVISYANEVKMDSLGVSPEILEKHGAVSEACIMAMANGVREKLQSTLSLASSGIAGPDGGTEEKPVGTVWIALSHPQGVITRKLQLAGTRKQIIHMTALNCLNLVRKFLLNELTQ
ncbi:competence/damage-inducible protein A [Aquirufa sp. Wall-65K1]